MKSKKISLPVLFSLGKEKINGQDSSIVFFSSSDFHKTTHFVLKQSKKPLSKIVNYRDDELQVP